MYALVRSIFSLFVDARGKEVAALVAWVAEVETEVHNGPNGSMFVNLGVVGKAG